MGTGVDILADIDKVCADIDKKYGKGSIIDPTKEVRLEADVISSGSLSLDLALGIGGYPRGRIVEIYGAESSGKTTLAIHAMAEATKAGGYAVFVDAEHAFDMAYAESIGVDSKYLRIVQPDNGEQGLDILEMAVKSGKFQLAVVDSVAALTPKAEIEGEMGDSKMGLHARLMSQAMRKLVSMIAKGNICVIFINQTREKIGVTFGNPKTTTGGNALKFYASVRLDVQRAGMVKTSEGEVTAIKSKVKVVKNKMATPFKVALFDIHFGKGISFVGELIDYCVEWEVIKKAGSWFSYEDTKLGQGREAVLKLLEDNIELANELEVKLYKELGILDSSEE